jgi:hypothetical protein
MATRSTIAKRNPDGTITSIYCHWDGYPEGVGATLEKHYTDPVKIDELLDTGDLSVLDAEIGETNSFEERLEGVCLFYGRDRGEDNAHALHQSNIDNWMALRKDTACEYGYLWDNDAWLTYKL